MITTNKILNSCVKIIVEFVTEAYLSAIILQPRVCYVKLLTSFRKGDVFSTVLKISTKHLKNANFVLVISATN